MMLITLPLEELDKCRACSKTESLRLCSKCGEVCPSDYEAAKYERRVRGCIVHPIVGGVTGPLTKSTAVRAWILILYNILSDAQGKTDRVELSAFYPVLACLVDHSHNHRGKPNHAALRHKVLNAPNPNSHVVDFPDGSQAKLVVLGDLLESGSKVEPEVWWPRAMTPEVLSKFFNRVRREGYVLPIITAVCLVLLTEMYATTPNGDQRRARLQYRSSPINDFGIAKGSVLVKNQDKFGYMLFNERRIFKGQDPDDHYWIYFTTLNGEDVFLDCAMFTFNMFTSVFEAPYLPTSGVISPKNTVPAVFGDRERSRNAPALHSERERFSILRDRVLLTAVENMGETKELFQPDLQNIYKFMERVAGRPLTPAERILFIALFYDHCEELAPVLTERKWRSFPETPPMATIEYSGEVTASSSDDNEDEKWFEKMKE
jgi:hypothetical protein